MKSFLPSFRRATSPLLLAAMCLLAAFSSVAAPPGRDEPKATGLHVEFYRGINFNYIEHVRVEDQVNYQWAHPVYAQGLEGLEFSARWTGRLRAPVDGMF